MNKISPIILFIFSLFAASNIQAQVQGQNKALVLPKFEKLPDLSPQEVAEKYKPSGSEIVHDVIKVNLWNSKNVIIAFYETRYKDDDENRDERQFIEGFLLVPDANKNNHKILINKWEDDNVHTEIRSVFLANADKDASKELIIISTCQHRLQYLYEGYEYVTDIYDNIDLTKIVEDQKLVEMPEVSARFSGFEGFLDHKPNSKAKFKNAEYVKKELKKLGY